MSRIIKGITVRANIRAEIMIYFSASKEQSRAISIAVEDDTELIQAYSPAWYVRIYASHSLKKLSLPSNSPS